MRMVDDAGRCENCAHWGKADDYGDEAQVLGVRRCAIAVELWEASTWDADLDRVAKPEYAQQKMFVMDGSSYSASLYTKPDFFCAHFRAMIDKAIQESGE